MDSRGRTGWTRWTLLADRQPRKQIVIATVRSPCKATHWYQVAAYLLQRMFPVQVPHRITFGPDPIPSMCAHVSFGTQRKNDQVEHLVKLFAIVFLSGKGPKGRCERRNEPELPRKWLAAFLLRTTRTMAGYPWAPIRGR